MEAVVATPRSAAALVLVLFLAATGTRAQEVAPSPQQAFAQRVIPLVSSEPQSGDAALRALVREAPFRAETLMQELLRQVADEGLDSWALGGARRIALALEAEGVSKSALAAVRAYERFDDAQRRRRIDCDFALVRTFEAANAGRWEEAEASARAMLELGEPLELPFVEARSRRTLGGILKDRGAYAAARAELERALELDSARGATLEIAQGLRALGETALRAGRPSQALVHFENVVLVSGKHLLAEARDAYLDLGLLLAFYGEYDEALAYLDAVLQEAPEPSDQRARALAGLATLAGAQGRYGDALRHLADAGEVRRAIGDKLGFARTLVLRGGIEAEIGRTREAETTLVGALELLAGDTTLERARAELHLGLARIDAGRPDDAIGPLDRALGIFDALGFELGRGEVLHQRARALADLGRAEDAERAWRDAIEHHRESGDLFRLALAYTGLGRALERRGGLDEAAEAYDAALLEVVELDSAETTWRAHGGLGRVEEARGNATEAIAAYRRALDALEEIRAQLGAPSLRLRYLEDKLELYRRVARLLARAGDFDEAFRWTEAAKARTLLELGAGVSAVTDAGGHPSHLRSLTAELAALETSLSSARRDGVDGESLERLTQRLERLREERSRARVALELASPDGALLSGTARLATLKEVRAALLEGEALIEFLVADDFSAAWVLRRDDARFVELACSGREVAAWVERLQRPLADLRAGRTDVASLGFDVDAARALHRALVAPLAEHLGSSELVWIVADGPLWGVPFGAFVVEYEKRAVDPSRLYVQYAGCRFWVEEAALALAPSASFLARGSGSADDAPRGWVLGAFDPRPLPADAVSLRAAGRELQSVGGWFQDPAPRLLHGEEATEARFKSELAAATWIHVAAHGYLDDERPEYSRIALAPAADGSEDGWLHAFEIEARTLAASSVILTACETAGTSLRAEGLLGLARAFLVAGAESVVASRWVVDDSAAALLVDRYYAALGRGERPPVALRSAQLALLEDGGRPGLAYVHPFFWAGYVHFGGLARQE